MYRNEAARIIAQDIANTTTAANLQEKAQDLYDVTDWSMEECIGALKAWMPK